MSLTLAPRPPRAVTIFVVAALVAGPPLEYLRYNHYPLFRPEVLLPTALWVLCAIGIGGLLNRAPRLLRIVAFSLLLLVFVDWQFSDHVDLSFKLVPVAIVAVVWLLERHLEKIAAVVLAAFYLSSIPTGNPMRASTLNFPTVARDTSLPPMLYLILDEHIGIEGWPAAFASTQAMQRQARRFYLDEGFRLFGRAYSEYTESKSSIPALLNWPAADPRTDVAEVVPDARYRVTTNELFRRLSAGGYRIRVYQSTYMEFCDRAYALRSCDTSPGNSIANISLHVVPLWSKVRLVAMYFLNHNSYIYGRLQDFYTRFAEPRPTWPRWNLRITKAGFLAAMQLLDLLEKDLRSGDLRGTVYFAHLLAPHHPYEVDAACGSHAEPSDWLDISPGPYPIAAGRAQRYKLYAAQTGCLIRRLQAVLRLIDSIPSARQMVVIVHGDHGSRIVPRYPYGPLAPRIIRQADLADMFSTLFAIRAPGIQPGYDERFVSVDELVGRALQSDFQHIDIPERRPHVVRLEANGVPFVDLRLSDTALVFSSRRDRVRDGDHGPQ